MNDSTKNLILTVTGGVLVYLIWEKWGRAFFLGQPADVDGDGIPDAFMPGGVGVGGTGSGGAGSGGAGGAGGAGGSGDFTTLAAAIMALANGVTLPNLQSYVKNITAAGTYELAPGVAGRLTRVYAYALSSASAGNVSVQFKSGATLAPIWRMDLETPAGKSGANLATSWPGFLFSTAPNEALNVTTDGAAVVTVSYWQEAE